MLSTLLACFLLWVLYLWLDRRRLLRVGSLKRNPDIKFSKSVSSGKSGRSAQSQRFFGTVTPTSSKPQFINSKPISEINREKRRAKQVPPDAPKKPPQKAGQPQPVQPVEPVQEPPQPEIKPAPPSKPEINFDAIQRETAKRQENLRKVSPKTQNDLYRLVRGDRPTVDRLINHGRARYPDKSEQWIWEKTIADLERDRR